MNSIKNNEPKKETPISEVVKKDIERLLRNEKGETPKESLGREWRETLNVSNRINREEDSTSLENMLAMEDHRATGRERMARKNNIRKSKDNYGRDKEQDNKKIVPSLKDRISMRDPRAIAIERERKAKEEFQQKLSKANKQSAEDTRKNIRERSRKIEERRKMALKKKLKEKMKKKLTMDAKKGKSPMISFLFIIFLLIGLLNDSVDIIVGIISWLVTLTGVGAIVLAITEIAGDIVDLVTTILLLGFSFYIGGKTKAGAKKIMQKIALFLGAFIIELIPLLNLFTTWFVVILYNWYDVRKKATEAERIDEEISQISGA